MSAPTLTKQALFKLMHLTKVNDEIDWRTFSFADPNPLQTLHWAGHEAEQEELLPLLKAYQRLLRILPPGEEPRALPLLGTGLHSAIQIASLPKPDFLAKWAALFPGEDALGETVYQNAVARRSHVLLQHIHSVQTNEPHYRAARFQ